MSFSLDTVRTLAARHGGRPQGLIFARISSIVHQDERSNSEQAARCREFIQQRFNVEADYRVISGHGSGERLDRDELSQLEQAIDSRDLDFVIAEDMSRFVRRYTAFSICERCEDSEVRLFTVNERIDTLDPNWRDTLTMVAWHHEKSNRDTSDRVTRSLRHRFEIGGIIQEVPFGYLKPPGIRTDSQLIKDPSAEPVVHDIFSRVKAGASFAEVAFVLNQRGIRPGPFCRRAEWNGAMVSRLVKNPIFKGVRERNRHMSQRINRTGRRITVRAPADLLLTRFCPHLEYVPAEEFDALMVELQQRNAWCRRSGDRQHDPLRGRPRTQTPFPGQHLKCGICGRPYYWHGAESRGVMVCSGATEYKCWNSLYVNGNDCGQAILERLATELTRLPGFDEVFGDLVRAELAGLNLVRNERRQQFQRRVSEIVSRQSNLLAAIERSTDHELLLQRLEEVRQELALARHALQQVETEPTIANAIPHADELRHQLAELIAAASRQDQELGRRLREVLPTLYVVPYHLIDGGDLVPRVEYKLDLAPLLATELCDHQNSQQFQVSGVITITRLPQRLELFQQAAVLRAEGLTRRQVAERLGICLSACARALHIDRLMRERGLTEPFERVTEMQTSMNRLRRHKSPRFRFEPLPGFPIS
jgi:site-specific DNA recombinase